jgi:aminoglycoside phosphotransferase (APT) family kinase protein
VTDGHFDGVIDATLVRRLVSTQFPQWAGLEIRPVDVDGWDNSTYRLGRNMTVRLPSNESYAAQVAKEQRWLPVLAPQLPLPIPAPLGQGTPSPDYPMPWSVYGWLDGDTVDASPPDDLTRLATSLAGFLNALMRVDPTGGPEPGPHNFYRGASLTTYDAQTHRALDALAGVVPVSAALEVWAAALAAQWPGPAVWFHGDVAAGNLLAGDGRLSAVIDFGSSGVGDPACDTAIAWTLLSGESRAAFRADLEVDANAWARGRGWTLWKALITIAGSRDSDPVAAARATRVLDEVLADHEQHG